MKKEQAGVSTAAFLQDQNAGLIPGWAQWVKDLVLPHLQLRSGSLAWEPRMPQGGQKKKKKKKGEGEEGKKKIKNQGNYFYISQFKMEKNS